MNHLRHPPLAVRFAVQAAVWALALSMVAPFLWMVATSLKTDAEATSSPTLATLLPSVVQWENYPRAVREAELGKFYVNSTLVAVATTLLGVAHNALAGYAFAKLRFRGKQVLFVAALATMMLPVTVTFVFSYFICQRLGYVNNYQALIVPFLASGFGIYYMRQVVAAVPESLLEAARMDGMREFEVFWNIVVPLSLPGIGALAVFTFANSWNAFFWPLITIDSPRYKTLPLAVAELSAGMYVQSWPVQMAAATILVLPLVVVFFCAQKFAGRGGMLAGIKEA